MKTRYTVIIVGIALLFGIGSFGAYKSVEASAKEKSEIISEYQTKYELQRSEIEELNEQLTESKELNVMLEAYKSKVTCDTYELTYYNETGSNTYTDTKPRHLQTVAVDPNVIPLGSRLMIEGYEGIFIAEDTGGAVKGNIIDIFYSGTDEELIQLGRVPGVKVCVYE